MEELLQVLNRIADNIGSIKKTLSVLPVILCFIGGVMVFKK